MQRDHIDNLNDNHNERYDDLILDYAKTVLHIQDSYGTMLKLAAIGVNSVPQKPQVKAIMPITTGSAP